MEQKGCGEPEPYALWPHHDRHLGRPSDRRKGIATVHARHCRAWNQHAARGQAVFCLWFCRVQAIFSATATKHCPAPAEFILDKVTDLEPRQLWW